MTAARVRPAAVSCSWTDWPTAASAGAEPDDFGVLVGDDGLEGGDAAVLLFVEGALEHLDPHGVGRRLDGGRGEEAFAAQVGFDVVEADPSTVTRVGLGLGVQARMDEPLALTRPCNGLPDTAGADTTGRLVGNRLADAMAHYEHLLGVMILTDDDVEAKQGVTLSREFPADEHRPIPKLFFDQRHRSPRSVANREFLVRKAVELLRAAGARTVRRMNWPPFIFHPHSTMRMGLDAANSVCDQNGAAPGVRHLYTDNSVLANALGGSNPTLTTQAVATRIAEKIFAFESGGGAWVGREGPVSPIDPVVTRVVHDQEPGWRTPR